MKVYEAVPLFEIDRPDGLRHLVYANGGSRYIFPSDTYHGPSNNWLWPVFDHWPAEGEFEAAMRSLGPSAKAMKGAQ